MKNIKFNTLLRLALASLLLTHFLAANPSNLPADSIFRPTGQDVETVMVLDSIRVYTGTQNGKDTIIKLKTEGYACKPALSKLWRCTRHLTKWNHPTQRVQQRIEEKISDLKDVSFGEIWGASEQTHDSEAYREWEMKQSMKLGTVETRYYRTRHLRDTDYFKLLPGKQGTGKEYLWNGETLSKIIELSISHKDGYTRYIFEVPYH